MPLTFNNSDLLTILEAIRFEYKCLRANNKASESIQEFKLRNILEMIEKEVIQFL